MEMERGFASEPVPIQGAANRWLLSEWFGFEGRERRAVLRALTELSDRRTPVHVEAEDTGLSFFTVITLRRDALLIVRPFDLRSGLVKNSFVRLTLPNRDRRQVRARILTPHLQMDRSLRHVCICEVPSTFAGTSRRASDRLCTTQFRNLRLQVPALDQSFRVLDLSASGIRIYRRLYDGQSQFALDAELAPASLRVGSHTVIALESVQPRSLMRNTIGLHMQVKRDGNSERLLVTLLNRLQSVELQRLHIGRR